MGKKKEETSGGSQTCEMQQETHSSSQPLPYLYHFHSLSVSYSLPSGKRGSSSSSSSSRHPSCELGPLSQCSTPPPRQRMLSEPWLAIHNLACLNQAYEEGTRERSPQEEGDREDSRSGGREDEEPHFYQSRMEERTESAVKRRDNRYGGENYNSRHEDFLPRVSQSIVSLTEMSSFQATPRRLVPKMGGSTSDTMTLRSDKLPACLSPHSQLRRNTVPSVMVVPPLLHLPPLVHQSDSHLQVPAQLSPSKSRSVVFLPHPPSSPPPSSRASVRPALLPPLQLASSVTSLVAPPASCCSERSRRSLRRHSVQLEQIRGGGGTI